MRAVDTDVLVRLIARDNAKQVKLAEQFIRGGAWVSPLVLAETVWVLQSVYELEASAIATTVAMLLQHKQLTIQDADVVQAALATFESANGVSFTDCLVVAIAAKAGYTPIGTFDRKLSKIELAELV